MTTRHEIAPIWAGQTVAVIGNGPSLTDELLAEAKGHPCIAVNRAARRAPWADMLVSIDGNWPDDCADFAGLRVVGVERDDLDALCVAMPYEAVTIAPGHVLHIRNNALSAIGIAAQAGAAEILLYGMDPAEYEALHDFQGFAKALRALRDELQALGVTCWHVNPTAATKKTKK